MRRIRSLGFLLLGMASSALAAPTKGVEAWSCSPSRRYYSDGRCYTPRGTCNPTGPRHGSACRRPGSWRRTVCSCPGEEAWVCHASRRYYSDGRCYTPRGTCNPTGARYGNRCTRPGAWRKTACACPPARPARPPAPAPRPAAPALGTGLSYSFSSGYHVVVADLRLREVRVAPPHNTPEEDRRTVAAHAQEVGATVAINANYFGGALNLPCGAARGLGRQFMTAYPEAMNCVTTLGWSRGPGGAIFDSSDHHADPGFMPQFTELATGGGYLLSRGQRRDWHHRKLEGGRGCTAIGLSADRTRYLFVVSNRQACTGAGLQNVLLAHGAADAIHLDGGGSSKMWIRGRGYVNDEPQDRAPSIVIYAR